VPDALLGDEQLSALRVKNVKTGELREIEADGLFVAIGIIPRTQLVADTLAINDGGYIITDRSMQTSVPGVYAVGDVRDTPLRQVVTAVADGAVAATSALERLA
ncbi:MAG: NAD(P)/FAD-dependent oxidoreductase, partial [Eubacteriales bacterium]|nr:NAD(P)/FAD-dependent oxidoreductase [Eubacteriales bacterium]